MIRKTLWIAALIILIFMIAPFSFADDLSGDAFNATEVQSNEYYFDSNVAVDGNGSVESPYKYLTEDRVKDSSVLHFNDGEYNFTHSKTHKDVTFIGSNTLKTFINCKGTIDYTGNIILTNITFSNAQFYAKGCLNASNVIFKQGVAKSIGSYKNSYGGAINASEGSYKVYLDNCTFIDNYAQYGGAIYMKSGLLEISNSLFIGNTAYNYGGAIACEKTSSVKIRNSSFIRSVSRNDAGGAIYISNTDFKADYLSVSDSNATFGGALTLLSTNSDLNHLNLSNNTAKYDGGAIYQFYNNFTINNSVIAENNAVNGGGLYLGHCEEVFLANTTFAFNNAQSYAGAFFSILNYEIFGLDDCLFKGNMALNVNDFHNADLNMFLSNINYTLYHYNAIYNGTLPGKYRTNGLIVKDQEDGGNCWAFAALAAVEAAIKQASGQTIDLSDENMKNLIALYSDYGWYKYGTNDGGIDEMAIGYLVSWLGPVLTSDDTYDGESVLSPLLNAVTHIQNIVYLKRDNFTDNDAIKRAVMDYGGVYTGIKISAKYDSNAKSYVQYYNGNDLLNHAVCIIGWDDDFTINGAPGKGAWICKNSWGSSWGNGYFYVSYYDTTCAKVGVFDASFAIVFNDTLKYDKNYQYDIPGKTDYYFTKASTIWYKNRFTATDDEYLAAVSTYFGKDTNWTLSVYVNDVLKSSQSGFSKPGYFTIELNDIVRLNEGDIFECIFKIDVDGDVGIPISEFMSLVSEFYDENMSFISLDGENWLDFYNAEASYPDHYYVSQAACLKAFTFIDEVDTDLSMNWTLSDLDYVITASVMNQYGQIVHGGNVTFNVNGIDVVVDVDDGIAKITLSLERGLNNISAQYNGVGFLNSSNSISIHVDKSKVNMALDITTNLDAANVIVRLSKPIDQTVIIAIDGNPTRHMSKDGIVEHVFSNLDLGLHTIDVSLESDEYAAHDINETFLIKPSQTTILADDLDAVYGSGEVLKVRLIDENSLPVADQTIIISLNGRTYENITDKDGFIYIGSNLAVGNYPVEFRYDGDAMHLNSTNSSTITIKTSIILSDHACYNYNSTYNAYFLDKNGNNLTGKVVIVLGGIRNEINAVNGVGSININLSSGAYDISVENLLTGEVKNQTIDVVKRITENYDLAVYYGSDLAYKVKILNDYGETQEGLLVTFETDGKSAQIPTDADGYATFSPDLDVGNYTVTASYKGFTVKNMITVKTTIALPAKSNYAANSTYSPNFINADKAKIIIAGTAHEIDVKDGVGSFRLDLPSGDYEIAVVNLLTGEIKNQNITVFDRITENDDLTLNYQSLIAYRVKVLDDDGNQAVNVRVDFTLDSQSYSNLTDNEGYATLYCPLAVGDHWITASYKDFTVKNRITVKTTLELPENTRYTYNSTYTVRFLDGATKAIIMVEDQKEQVNVINGEASVLFSMAPETYSVRVINLLSGEEKIQTIEVVERIVENRNISRYYGSSDYYTVRALDGNANPIGNVMVRFSVNGVGYERFTDKNGYAKLDVELEPGMYDVSAEYKGFVVCNALEVKSTINLLSDKYAYNAYYKVDMLNSYGEVMPGNAQITLNGKTYDNLKITLAEGSYDLRILNLITGEVKSQKITVVKRITSNKDVVMYYGAGKSYKVRVYDDNGNAAQGAKVTFRVNNKNYYRYTDSNGYATLKLSLNPNKYTITATYAGVTVKNKITVKTTIITSNVVVKKGKTIKFTAKLLNSNGKILKYKKVTIKFKGKTYKVATNNKGIATLKITKKYGVGKYTIQTSYGKLTVKNSVIIKK